MSIFQGDVVDVMFRKNLHLRAVYIVTGFDRDEERAGNDRLVSGQLSVASDLDCRLWQPIRYEAISTFCQEKTKTGQTFMLGCCKKCRSSVDQWGKMASNASIVGGTDNDRNMRDVHCLRLQVSKATSDWLVIRLIRVLPYD